MDTDTLLIHVRFAPNGTVVEIGERPKGFTPQEWFNRLSDRAGDHYRTLAGGRGMFRLTRANIQSARQSVAA